MTRYDATTDPALRSWVRVPDGSDFPIQNLPLGVISRGAESPRVAAAIGDDALDLALVAEAGLLDGALPGARGLFAAGSLNGFLARGRAAWSAGRARLSALLSRENEELRDVPGLVERALFPRAAGRMHLPFAVGDYVDFYSSIEHATNLGRLFRPDGEPLLPNYRYVPIGYHGRAGSIVVGGTPVRRPHGQRRPNPNDPPTFGPSAALDIELEVGFVAGAGSVLGSPIPASAARDHIYGLVLVNDWSARDIQAWEYQPLGPFLGKSFATSISPWVVSLDALEPHRVEGPAQEPPVFEYLRVAGPWNYEVELSVALQSAEMARCGVEAAVVSTPTFRRMYWNMAQQLAHATVNGAAVRPGDLFASGTVSDLAPHYGSLIELTWQGSRRLPLPDGTTRAFLEDGDTVVLAGHAGGRDGAPRIGFGEVTGRVED
ncbi:MAG TPA: fumarylacetoacetase [Candidatus Dormibacteraeota bacterium]|nr:fumarylacetoacetase [Candidatus Dormibacteraeota bacterium]